ncbi:gamma-glutamyl hercynylcysteine S-oxide synthase [Anaerolineales bacterium]|nr:gamma-glutamyl hercynylcysteine S-oxide synthase [Anaerolineales bacterium]
MKENRKLKVFLCHSKDDKTKVRELYQRLVADGYDAWFDEEKLMPGKEWDLEIRQAVRESDVVVVCLSNGSVAKTGYVQKEIRFALDIADEQPEGAIYLVPAKLEECQVPARVSKWQWVSLFESSGYEKLKLSLNLRANTVGASISYFIEPQMARIPEGKFLMGSTLLQAQTVLEEESGNSEDWKEWIGWEQPQHIVELSEYFIGKYPITNREYQAFLRDVKCSPPYGWNGDQFPTDKGSHPVVYVSWDNAVAYCKWLSGKTSKPYRLPTEAEWEKAARSEDGRTYPWGNEFDPEKANTDEANIGGTSDVGKFSPQGDSPYGCADMIGNVWEWCADAVEKNGNKKRKVADDQETTLQNSLYVVRGGSFYRAKGIARCASRTANLPHLVGEAKGFRVAFSPIRLENPD